MSVDALAPSAFRWRRFLAVAGPGIVVMLADTDAGSVITAAQSGAQWGYSLLLLQFILIPILYLVQELTVRLGAVTGKGHAELIKQQFGRGWAWLSVATLIITCLGALLTEFAGLAGVGNLIGVPAPLTLTLVVAALMAMALMHGYMTVERIAIAVGAFELERADGDRDALDRHVAVHERHRHERRHDERQRKRGRDADEVADAGEAREFGQERAEAGDDQRRDREPRPAAAKLLLDQFRVSLAGHGAKADGQLLHEVENGDQNELQQQEAIAPLGAALRRRDHAAGVGVGQHHHNAGAGDGEEAAPAEGGRSESVDGHGYET